MPPPCDSLATAKKEENTFDARSYSLRVKTLPFLKSSCDFSFENFCLEIVVMFPLEQFKMVLDRSKSGL